MLLSATAFVLVLALFLAFGGLMGYVIGKAVREGRAAKEAAGGVLILTVIFAAVALLTLELALPPLEQLLLGA